jgi:hypothetical protein
MHPPMEMTTNDKCRRFITDLSPVAASFCGHTRNGSKTRTGFHEPQHDTVHIHIPNARYPVAYEKL